MTVYAACHVRTAEVCDAEAIATIHVRAWQAAYAHIFSSSFLDGLSIERRTSAWKEILNKGDDVTLVAMRGDEILGWTSGGLSADEDVDHAAELKALYVSPLHWRAGVGTQLMRALDQQLPVAPRTLLWVLEKNDRAIRFYEQHGFRPDGAMEEIERGGGRAIKLRFAREIPR